MTRLTTHRVTDNDPDRLQNCPELLASIHPASPEMVNYVLAQSPDHVDGRSQWMWVRLPNGDLILGVYPQGDTYCAVEADAMYPD